MMISEFSARGHNAPIKFRVADPDDTIQRQFRMGRFYAEPLMRAQMRVMPVRSVALDIGANIGNHAVFYALIAKAKHIFVFEPNPVAHGLLAENIALNDIETVDFTHSRFGIGKASARARLRERQPRNLGSVALDQAPEGEVEIRSLDSLDLPKFDFMKIDVEGMEIDVLEGAEKSIRAARPAIAVEVSARNNARFWRWCERMRYHVVDVARPHKPYDYLCVPKF
ncbi:MAG: FkbM family methyltransferase [Pseudomonadota bacterium]